MADKKITVDIIIETANSASSIKDIKKSIDDLTNATKEFGEGTKEFDRLNEKADELNNKLKQIGQAGKKGQDGLQDVAKGFNGIGLAIKASGIGLVIGLFAALKTVLEKQQPVLDAIDTAFTTIGIVITQVSDALTAAFESTSKANGGFDATKKVVSGLITIALAPLKLIIDGIKAAVITAQLIWEKSFFGKGDPKRIKELKKELSDVKDDVISIGKDVGKAAVDVASNVIEAGTEIGNFVSTAAENISKISVEAAIAQAKRTTELKNQALIAAAVNQGLIEQYDALAEKQRQIRDNDTLTVAERIEANDKLGKVLEKQQAVMLQNANIGIQAAKLELAANNTIENKVKLIEAQNEKSAVLAQIEGFRSEQIVNRIALEKESLAIQRTLADAESERTSAQREFEAERIVNDSERLNKEKENLEIESQLELDRLDKIRQSAKEGTQARADADVEYLAKKQELGNQLIAKDDEIQKQIIQDTNTNAVAARELAIAKNEDDIQLQIELLETKKNIELEDANLTANEKLLIEQKYINDVRKLKDDDAEKDKALKQQHFDDTIAFGLQSFNAISALSDSVFAIKSKNLKKGSQEELKAAKANFNVNKAMQLATATITGIGSVMEAYKNGMKNPIPLLGPATGAIYAVTAGITAAANVAKISATKFEGGGTVDTSTPPTPQIPTPATVAPRLNDFSLFGTAGRANNLGATTTTVQAVVVESDITSSQNKIKNFKNASELGG